MGTAVTLSHIVSAAASSSEAGFLNPSLVPAWSPTQQVQAYMNFSQMCPSHGLQCLTNCSSVDLFLGMQSCRNRLFQHASPVRSQVLKSAPVQAPLHSFTDPDRSLLHHDLPAGSKPPSDIHLLQYGILCGLHVDLCSNMHHHRLQGHSCLAMVFSTSCRGTSGQHLEHLLPLPHCSWCLQGSCSYVVSLLCSLAANTPVQ